MNPLCDLLGSQQKVNFRLKQLENTVEKDTAKATLTLSVSWEDMLLNCTDATLVVTFTDKNGERVRLPLSGRKARQIMNVIEDK
jgi:hypothetical protein